MWFRNLKLNEVTLLSKTIAAVLFIVLPFAGFYLGIQYQKRVTPHFTNTNSLFTRAPSAREITQGIPEFPVPSETPYITPTPEVSTSGEKIFRNRDFGFSMKYPEAKYPLEVMITSEFDNTTIQFTDKTALHSKLYDGYSMYFGYELTPENQTVYQYIQKTYSTVSQDKRCPQNESGTPTYTQLMETKVGNRSAYTYERYNCDNGVLIVYYLVHKDKLVVVQVILRGDNKDIYRKEINEYLASVVFDNS
jgi:hypothetical protein